MDAVTVGGGARRATEAALGGTAAPDAAAGTALFGALATGAGVDVAMQPANGSAAVSIKQKTGPTRIDFPLHERIRSSRTLWVKPAKSDSHRFPRVYPGPCLARRNG
jgi:hypothetical protein